LEGKVTQVANDLTLLLATANQLDETVAKKIRDYVIEVTENKYPIVSVSQKPIDFGTNICIGEIGTSKYNEYKQILIGAKEVKTKYTAVIDDDVLYAPCHFLQRPSDDLTFLNETHYWFAQDELDYFWRPSNVQTRGGMWGCIANTETLLNNLTKRYEMYPVDPWADGHKSRDPLMWGEPGLKDEQFGMVSKYERVESKDPSLIFVHSKSMGYNQLRKFYRRYGLPTGENKTYILKQFGTMEDVRYNYWK
jgi:hypothetical protein